MRTKGYKKIFLDIASPNLCRANILLIYTGGTFGMEKGKDGTLIPFDFNKVLENIPVIKSFDLHISVIAFDEPIDSSDINPDYWSILVDIISREEAEHDGFVILHGTDTMAFTASALSYALLGLNKPVIITGAQLPVSVPRTDARENLITSLEIASSKNEQGEPIISEVCIFFNHHLIRGNRAQKVQSSKFDAFRSENYPALAEAGIEINYNHAGILSKSKGIERIHTPEWDTRVAIIKIFPGISREAVELTLKSPSIKGVILETFGAGNTMTARWFIECISEATKREVLILNVSQCLGGEVNQGMYAAGTLLEKAGVISGSDITLEAAITKLMFVLGQQKSYKNAINQMLTPICGELS
ncbi:MAG: asparaginase [Cyclobacteriaceae bacterium]|nr:asparaginase [Cyclobacteriaceae bacterium]